MNESANMAPWQVRREPFPEGAAPELQLRYLARYALLAPSNHNTQPWRFAIAGNVLDLHADRRRSLHVIDPRDRQLTISCGAALFNLRTALYFFGCAGSAQPFPDPAQPDLLARVTLDPSGRHLSAWQPLFEAITERCTNRGPFEPEEIPVPVETELRNAAHHEGAHLTVFRSAHAKALIGELVAEADRRQFANPEFRRELASWLHSARDRDGIPGYARGAAELFDIATPAVAYIVRRFDVGGGVAARDNELAQGSPLLACLSTSRDDPIAWLLAGEALQRVLLLATSMGLHASFLNQPIEVPELRASLAALTGRETSPQILLRLGRGRPVRHTPRRPLEDVLIDVAAAPDI
jgi:nitroreductase